MSLKIQRNGKETRWLDEERSRGPVRSEDEIVILAETEKELKDKKRKK